MVDDGATGCNRAGVALEIAVDDPANLMAVLDNRLLVQVRMGSLTHAALDAAAAKILPLLMMQTKAIGALAIVNGDVGVMPPDIQARQRQLLDGVLARPNAWMVTVMQGSTVQATAMRAVGRVLMLGRRNIKHAKDTNEATSWLGEKLGDISAGSIRDAVEQLQKRAKP